MCKLSPVSFGRANAMKFAHRILISTIKKGEIWLILHDDISVFPSPAGAREDMSNGQNVRSYYLSNHRWRYL